jgi:ParB family transcriptional regulator, chromosome partitioning protein
MPNTLNSVSNHQIQGPTTIQLLPVDRIRVLNSRSRNKKIYAAIVDNIAQVGLKRPITVTTNSSDADGPLYHLVCGEGRLDAFKALGETHIPCFVVTVSESDAYLMSLVENLARRRHSNDELLGAIRTLQSRGYTTPQIASKTGLDPKYVSVMLHLLRHSEQRLVAAVERGWLSISLADRISRAGDAEMQSVMMEAYEKGLLRGEQLMKVRRLIDRRLTFGRRYRCWSRRPEKKLTPDRLVQTYQTEVRRQRLTIKKAEVTEGRLLFILTALRRFLTDENFRTLMRAEGIDDIPKQLADRLKTVGRP